MTANKEYTRYVGRPDLLPFISLDPYFGEPTAQLFVAVLESSASTPAAHALANE